jgi:O-antigen/teichoic acid export membrane protein
VIGRLKYDPIGATLFSLVTDSAVYLFGSMLIGLCNVVLVPLYTRALGPREFGVYALLDITVLLVVALTALKMDVSYLKWFADTEPSLHPALFGSMLLTGLATSTLGGSALFAFVASRAGTQLLQQSAHSFAWMLFPIVVLEALQTLFLTDLRARRMAGRYSAAAIIRLLFMVAASIYLLPVRHMGLVGLFLGRLIGDTAAFVYLIGLCTSSFVLSIRPSLIRPMIRFGVPLILSVFAVMFQDASGRYFLSRYGSMEQVGLLGAAVKIAGIFQLVIAVPFGVAWGGVLFQIVKQRDAQMIYSKIFLYVYVVSLGVAFVFAIFSPTLVHMFTAPAFYPAASVLPIILLVRAMSVIEQPSATGIYLAGRTHVFAGLYTLAAAGNLALLALLVPRYGLLGVGWSWLISSTVVPVLNLTLGQKHYALSLRSKLLLVPVVPWALVVLRWPMDVPNALANRFLTQCALCCAVLVGLGWLLVSDMGAVRRRFHEEELIIPTSEVTSQ